MAEQKLGRVVPLLRGEYDATRTYELNDLVTLVGSTWWHVGKDATTGVSPVEGDVWRCAAEKGDTGNPTDAQVAAWLDSHPEATTTVENGSITSEKLASSVKSTFNSVVRNLDEWGVRHNLGSAFAPYTFPDDAFDAFGVNFLTDGRNFVTDFDVTDRRNTGGTTYYVSPDGSNGNAGTDRDRPLASYPASKIQDGDTVVLLDGIYHRSMMNHVTVHHSVNIVAEHSGKAIVRNSDSYEWEAVGGNVYHTVRRSVNSVVMRVDDTWVRVIAVSSLEDCESTAMSYYTSDSDVYVNGGGFKVADDTVFLNLATGYPVLVVSSTDRDVNFYTEGVVWEGGVKGGVEASSSAEHDLVFSAKDCKFVGGYTNTDVARDGISFLGCVSFLDSCEVMLAHKSGFNYHSLNGKICTSFEINCSSHDNGAEWPYTNCNGSTTHDGCIVLRANGAYYGNRGPNVADVNDGTKSLNLGCLAFDSTSEATIDNCGFGVTDFGQMYLDNCYSFGNDWDVSSRSGASMSLHRCRYTTKHTDGGTITSA